MNKPRASTLRRWPSSSTACGILFLLLSTASCNSRPPYYREVLAVSTTCNGGGEGLVRVDPDPDIRGAEILSQSSPFERVEMITAPGSHRAHLRVYLPGGIWCDPIDLSVADGYCECSSSENARAGCAMNARVIGYDEPSRGPNHQPPMGLPSFSDDASSPDK